MGRGIREDLDKRKGRKKCCNYILISKKDKEFTFLTTSLVLPFEIYITFIVDSHSNIYYRV